jgi:F-type H+-transporting ATPase subunit gamma
MAANLKEVRERIRSVNSTQQITKAMKMVSAAKLRRAQQAIQQMRPYAEKQSSLLRNILSNLDGDFTSTFSVQRTVSKACVVVVTSNRGLCGAFNTNVVKAAIQAIEDKYKKVLEDGSLTILCVGKKGYETLVKRYPKAHFIRDYVSLFENLSFDSVAKVPTFLMDAFEKGEFDAVDIAYGRFKNAATQFAELEAFLPVPPLDVKDGAKNKADYIFEPDKSSLLTFLIPSILKSQFQKCVLDTNASEHGARMTAMDKATDNANELLRELKISYNKARQESITKEILEIVGGASALASS